MPKYSKRKYPKKRRASKKFSATLSLNKMRGPVPYSQVVKMRYSAQINIDPAAGLAASHIFRANSLFDPDYSAVGHQPLGRDEWSVFYGKYLVIGSKITAQFASRGVATGSSDAICGIRLQTTTATEANAQLLMESSDTRKKYMGLASGGTASRKITHFYEPKKFLHIKDPRDDDGLVTNFGSNAIHNAMFQVFMLPMGTADDVQSTPIWVTIEYAVLLTSPIPLTTGS